MVGFWTPDRRYGTNFSNDRSYPGFRYRLLGVEKNSHRWESYSVLRPNKWASRRAWLKIRCCVLPIESPFCGWWVFEKIHDANPLLEKVSFEWEWYFASPLFVVLEAEASCKIIHGQFTCGFFGRWTAVARKKSDGWQTRVMNEHQNVDIDRHKKY